MASNVIRVSFLADAKQLTDSFKSIEKESQKLSDKLNNVGSTLNRRVTLPLLGVGVAGFKMAADLKDAQGATDQIFKNAGNSVKEWASEFPDYYGIAEAEALSHANIMGSLLKNLGGMSEEAAAEQSQLLVKLAGDLTAMFGGTTESAVQALTGALKGNNTMLDNYGIAANDASVKAEALAMGIWDGTGALTQQQKQAATLSLIMKQTGAAQGQAGREAEGASGRMRALTTGLKEWAATIGEVLLPIGTQLLGWLQGAVEWFRNLDPAAQKTIVVLGGVAAAVGPVLIVGAKLVTSFNTIKTAFQGINLVMKLNPYVALIAATIALVTLIVANWDKIKKFLTGVWDNIKKGVSNVTGWIKDTWNGVIDWFKNLPSRISGAVAGLFDGVKNAFKNAINWIIGKWNDFKIQIKLPGILGGGTITIDTPNIPKFHQGGIFHAPTPGGEGLAILRDGERVLTPAQSRSRGIENAASFNVTVNALDPQSAAKAVVEALQAYMRTHGAVPINVRV